MNLYMLGHDEAPLDKHGEVVEYVGGRVIGVFSSKKKAKKALKKVRKKKGFKVHKDSFYIEKTKIGKLGWNEGFNSPSKRIPVQKENQHLKISYPYGTTYYSIRITSSEPIPIDVLQSLLADRFYYSYTLELNAKNEFNTMIDFDVDNIEALKPIIPILMQYAHNNTVWGSLTSEYDVTGLTMPSYILALVKEDYILGFDFSVILGFE